MALQVDRKTGVPLYVQLREQMAQMIESGLWRRGMKLPTERHLARVLGLSRNTVSLAYKGLADRGLVVSQQGRGTFVRGGDASRRDATTASDCQLELLLESVIDQVVELGHDLEEVEREFLQKLRERRRRLSEVQVAFVECNHEQLDYFSRSLELGAGVHVVPILLPELAAGPRKSTLLERLLKSDLVVTTFFHVEDVRRIVGSDVEVVGIALDPEVESMVRIAQLPRDCAVGLVCLSDVFGERVLKTLAQSGLDYFDIEMVTAPSEEALAEFLRRVDAVIVSPGRRRDVQTLCGPETEIIEFIYKPDAGSINTLQKILMGGEPIRKGRG